MLLYNEVIMKFTCEGLLLFFSFEEKLLENESSS